MIASKIIGLKIFLGGASLIVAGRLAWALAFGRIRLRSKTRVRAENPVQFWSAVRIESYWLVLFLLPATFAVLNFPSPLPTWFKIAMMSEAVIGVGVVVLWVIITGLRERKRDSEYVRKQLIRSGIEPDRSLNMDNANSRDGL